MTDVLSEVDLQRLAELGAAELGPNATADELLRWTDENFTGNYIVASNMQDAVLVDMAAKVRPGVDVLFLDTGYHFVETIGTRDAVQAVYDVNVVNVAPERTVAEQDSLFGKDLFAREPNECCRMRKVEPLSKALSGYSAWVTGIRRVEAPTRANAPLISWDKAFGLVKINPLAAWSDDEMDAYIAANGVLVNPLVEDGYPSIGCLPCTAKPAPGSDPRSGRWAGTGKVECGLHAS
ncbi:MULTISPECIES: phosphoadenylyl-sulfate reductase [Mycobacteriaceae]|uniref:phosphoadenylyl-sulfate reductase n=1 Tax=Mycobacteriaceae TaxID=1762 RepID=UPI0007FDC369|nr:MULTISPECIES: phosphoadenylyl-sulfate reductase [Mycobacteriaceae]MCK0173556.1 phosphoadenylyl-sulfate reductase [Mycolicibacterium sp. F2034L]OBB56112.1 phosphoadenosine phosphosulfate reductase [Mycobacterium sp. 852013-51886_SCH5428379]